MSAHSHSNTSLIWFITWNLPFLAFCFLFVCKVDQTQRSPCTPHPSHNLESHVILRSWKGRPDLKRGPINPTSYDACVIYWVSMTTFVENPRKCHEQLEIYQLANVLSFVLCHYKLYGTVKFLLLHCCAKQITANFSRKQLYHEVYNCA